MNREIAATGEQLFGTGEGGMGCLACHPAGETLPTKPVLTPDGVFDWRQFDFTIPEDTYYLVWRQGAGFASKDGFASQETATQWAHYAHVENTALYWHFVDLVWIFLFPIVYLL